MPNCFSLTPKGSTEPEDLTLVDEKMREYFEAPSDPVNWYERWHDWAGLMLAYGKSFTEIREFIGSNTTTGIDDQSDAESLAEQQRLIAIIDWLDANYVPDAWAEIGRRR